MVCKLKKYRYMEIAEGRAEEEEEKEDWDEETDL